RVGREGVGAAGGRRGDGAVVVLRGRCAAGAVAVGPVAGGEAPDVRAVVRPAAGVGDGVGPAGKRGAAAVLEVVEALRAHEGVADAAEVDPDVAVLVAEERREGEV